MRLKRLVASHSVRDILFLMYAIEKRLRAESQKRRNDQSVTDYWQRIIFVTVMSIA